MEQHEHNRAAGLLALRALPRSVGMLTGAATLALTLDPLQAIQLGIGLWFAVFLFKIVFIKPTLVDINLWSCISTPILAIGTWPVRWFLYIGLVAFSLFRGAPFGDTILYMGGFFVFDLIIVLTRGS